LEKFESNFHLRIAVAAFSNFPAKSNFYFPLKRRRKYNLQRRFYGPTDFVRGRGQCETIIKTIMLR
jgi:hypothetical protein